MRFLPERLRIWPRTLVVQLITVTALAMVVHVFVTGDHSSAG